MKLKHKTIILLLFISICAIFCLNEVNAVGRVSYAWKIVNDGAPALVYRTFVTPHDDTVKVYTTATSSNLVKEEGKQWTYITSNKREAASKWVYGDDITAPTYRKICYT